MFIINQHRNSELILELGNWMISKHASRFDSDSTSSLTLDAVLLEEFFLAALDMKQFDRAEYFLKIVGEQYPQSVKSMRMLGMMAEAQSDVS